MAVSVHEVARAEAPEELGCIIGTNGRCQNDVLAIGRRQQVRDGCHCKKSSNDYLTMQFNTKHGLILRGSNGACD